MSYNTYLFDFDYTLANSEKGIVMCFEKLFKQYNYPEQSTTAIASTIGLSMPKAISILTGETDPVIIKNLQNAYRKFSDVHMTPNTFLYPESIPTLKKLKTAGYNIGIVSNKTAHRISQTLTEAKIDDLIDIIIGTEEAKEPKPSAKPLLQALNHFSINAASALYIGDSTIDAQTAQNASVDFAAVLTGQTEKKDFAAFKCIKIMDSLSEL